MTDPRETLARIRAQADAATEGPWTGIRYPDGFLGRVIGGNGFGVAEDFSDDADAEFIAAARTNVPRLVDALEKALILHKPVEVEPSETICSGCSTLRGQGETARYFPFTEYPCPTVRDITTALEGETP